MLRFRNMRSFFSRKLRSVRAGSAEAVKPETVFFIFDEDQGKKFDEIAIVWNCSEEMRPVVRTALGGGCQCYFALPGASWSKEKACLDTMTVSRFYMVNRPLSEKGNRHRYAVEKKIPLQLHSKKEVEKQASLQKNTPESLRPVPRKLPQPVPLTAALLGMPVLCDKSNTPQSSTEYAEAEKSGVTFFPEVYLELPRFAKKTPLVVIWNCPAALCPYVANQMKQFRCLFASEDVNWDSLQKTLSYLTVNAFWRWSSALPQTVVEYAAANSIPVQDMDYLECLPAFISRVKPKDDRSAALVLVHGVSVATCNVLADAWSDRQVAAVASSFDWEMMRPLLDRLENVQLGLGEFTTESAHLLWEYASRRGWRTYQVAPAEPVASLLAFKHELPNLVRVTPLSALSQVNEGEKPQEVPGCALPALDSRTQKRAEDALHILREMHSTLNSLRETPRRNANAVLVVGTKPDKGKEKTLPELDQELMALAEAENPDRVLRYLRHPVLSDAALAEIAKKFPLFECESEAITALKDCDTVYTDSSPLGFTALLLNKNVVATAPSFYAGRGLTDDRFENASPTLSMTLVELFAGQFLDAQYFMAQPTITGELSFEEVLGFLFAAWDTRIDTLLFDAKPDFPLDNPDKFLYEPLFWEENPLPLLSWLRNVWGRTTGGKLLLTLCEDKSPRELIPLLFNGKSPSELLNVMTLLAYLHIFRMHFDYNCEILDEYLLYEKENRITFGANEILVSLKIIELYCGFSKARVPQTVFLPYDVLEISSLKIRQAIAVKQISVILFLCNGIEKINRDYVPNDPESFLFDAVKRFNGGRRDFGSSHWRILKQTCLDNYQQTLGEKYRTDFDQKINAVLVHLAQRRVWCLVHAVEKLIAAFLHVSRKNCSSITLKRFPSLLRVVDFLISHDEIDIAERLLLALKPFLQGEGISLRSLLIRIHKFSTQEDSELFNDANNTELLNSPSVFRQFIRFESQQNNWARTIHMLDELCKNPKVGFAEELGFYQRKVMTNFMSRSKMIQNSVSQPYCFSKGIVFSFNSSPESSALTSALGPLSAELKRYGYIVVNMFQDGVKEESTGYAIIDKFAGFLKKNYRNGGVQKKWEINWKERLIRCDGTNYYQGVYESLTMLFRRFHIDIDDSEVADCFYNDLLPAMDNIVRVCDKIYRDFSSTGIPIVVLSGQTHCLPSSIIRDYSYAKDSLFFRCVLIAPSYEAYLTGSKKGTGTMINAVDLTKYRECRGTVTPPHERFEAWYQENRNSSSILDMGRQMAAVNRSGTRHGEVPDYYARILQAKKEGKKVICCLGRVVFDMGMPVEGGNAHTDMADWLNHTIETLGGKEDFLLLIKPHPHELSPNITLGAREQLRDLIPGNLPENVIFMRHRDFNTYDLSQFVDLVIIWTGTASMELTLAQIPVMMCAHHGRLDFPAELIYPESREQYASYLLAGEYRKPSEETCRRATAYLAYLGSPEAAIPFPYMRISLLNEPIRAPYWNEKALEEYYKYGDHNLTRLVHRIVEGMESDPDIVREAFWRLRQEERRNIESADGTVPASGAVKVDAAAASPSC